MNNGDRTAYPVDCRVNSGDSAADGFTKREAMAMAAMQGILSNPHKSNGSPIGVAQTAISFADALLKELEKTE